MAVLAIDIGDACYNEILVENETLNAASYLEFIKDCQHGDRKHAVWLIDNNA